MGQKIRDHAGKGIAVHLFVRDRKKTSGGRPAPFVYCGELELIGWTGDQPIEVDWRLLSRLPDVVLQRFTLDAG